MVVQHDWELVVSGSASALTAPLQLSHLQLSVWQPQRGYQPPSWLSATLPSHQWSKRWAASSQHTCLHGRAFSKAESTVCPSPSFPLQRTLYTKHVSKAPGLLPWIFNSKSVVHEAPPCQWKDRISPLVLLRILCGGKMVIRIILCCNLFELM